MELLASKTRTQSPWQPTKEMELVEVPATRSLKDRVGQQEKKHKFYGVQSPEHRVVPKTGRLPSKDDQTWSNMSETDDRSLNSWPPVDTLFLDKPNGRINLEELFRLPSHCQMESLSVSVSQGGQARKADLHLVGRMQAVCPRCQRGSLAQNLESTGDAPKEKELVAIGRLRLCTVALPPVKKQKRRSAIQIVLALHHLPIWVELKVSEGMVSLSLFRIFGDVSGICMNIHANSSAHTITCVQYMYN